MDVTAEQTEPCHGARPYSPSDVMTYDISSDESVTKTRIEFRPIVETSSSSSDSSDDSSSSYEYRWEEAKPAKPPFEPFITSVNFQCTDLPAIKREYSTVIPLKVILKNLLPNGSSIAFKEVGKLGIYQLTKYEADLLANHVNGLKTSVSGSFEVHDDGSLMEFNRGDVACSYKSLKEYVGLLKDEAIGLNSKVGKEDRRCDAIGRRNNVVALLGAPSDPALVGPSHLEYSDDDSKKSKENRSSRNSSTSSSKNVYVDENLRKKKARALGNRVADAKTMNEVDDEPCLNEALSRGPKCKYKAGKSPVLENRVDSCYIRNGVVLRHLYPENEDEDFDSEISRVLSIVRRKRNPRKIRGESTTSLPCRIVENSDVKEYSCERATSTPSLPHVKAKQDSQTKGERGCETDGENGKKCELVHGESTEEMMPTTNTNWKPVDDTGNNSGVQRNAHVANLEERIASTSAVTSGSSAIRIFWNTPKIVPKTTGISVFSENDTSKTETVGAAARAPITAEVPFKAGSHTSDSQLSPSTSCISNQPRNVNDKNEAHSESNDSAKLESEWAVTDLYVCKNPDHYVNSSARKENDNRCRRNSSNCDHRELNNRIRRPNSTEIRVKGAKEGDNSDSKYEEANRKDTCQHPNEALSSTSSSGRRKKGTSTPTVSEKVLDQPKANYIAKTEGKERTRSKRSPRIYRNSSRRADSSERDGKISHRRNAVTSRTITTLSRKRNTKERSRSSEKSPMYDNCSSKNYAGVVLPSVDAPKAPSTKLKEEERISENNHKISYQYSTNYSKLRYTYDSTVYSPISSDDADFGFSDSCDDATCRPKTRKVLCRRSVRDGLRTSSDRSEERRKIFHDESPKAQSYLDVIRYPTARVNDSNEDDSSITVTPNLLLNNPSNSRLKANVENLVVSIRSQCNRDVSVVENRSKLLSRRVVARRSPKRRRNSKQWTRRRSHSPPCLRSVSPVTLRRRGPKRRRSLSPARTRHSREKGNVEIDAAGSSAKLFRRHKRDSAHPLFLNLTDNERSDEVGNRLVGTHDSEMRYSSLQSSQINCSQDSALSSVDRESDFQDKYHELYSAGRSAFSDVKSVSNDSGNNLVRRREVRHRLDSTGLAPMAYELLPANETSVDDDEIVIFKTRNPLDECWPFFFHKSDEGMSSEDEKCDDEGCFMIGKLIASLRSCQKTTGIKMLQGTKGDSISTEVPLCTKATSVESVPINLWQPEDLSMTVSHEPSGDGIKSQLDVTIPGHSQTLERNTPELRDNKSSGSSTMTSNISDDMASELAVTSSGNVLSNPGGELEEERCYVKSFAVINREATDRSSDEFIAVDATNEVQCVNDAVIENMAIDLPLRDGCNTKETAKTSDDCPAGDNFQTVVRRQISPVVEVATAVASPCAYEEVAIAGDDTVDKANPGSVSASALQENLLRSDSGKVIVSKNETSLKWSGVCQQAAHETSSPQSMNVESPNIFNADQDGMCIGATITVEDEKCSRATPRKISNELSGVKSWKKKLIEKAQSTVKSNETNVENFVTNSKIAAISEDPFRESICLPAAVNFSRDNESVNIEKVAATSMPFPDKSLSSNKICHWSPEREDERPSGSSQNYIDSPRGSNEKDGSVDKRHNSPARNETNHTHCNIPNNGKNGCEGSAQGSHTVPNSFSTEGFPGIRSGEKDSAAKSTHGAGEYESVNIPTIVDNTTSVHTTVSADSPFSTSEVIAERDDMMPAVSVGQSDGSDSNYIPEKVTTSLFKDTIVSVRSHTSERLVQDDVKSASVTESVISRPEENPPEMARSISENTAISWNVLSSTSEHIHQPSEETTLKSTDLASEVISVSLEAVTVLPKYAAESGSRTSRNFVEGPMEDSIMPLAPVTLNSVSGKIILEGSPRALQENKSLNERRGVPNTLKSTDIDSKIDGLSSKHTSPKSSPVQNPSVSNERLSPSADEESKLEQQDTTEVSNLSPTYSTCNSCPLSSANSMSKKHSELECVSLGEAEQILDIITSRANSLSYICDGTSVVQAATSKDLYDSSTADVEHNGEKPITLFGCNARTSANDGRFYTVTTTITNDKETETRTNFSISGTSGSPLSRSGTIASCLSSSRIFASTASSITIVNRPPSPVGLSNKSAFRGPSVELKSKQPKTIMSKPWERTVNALSSSSLPDARTKRQVAAWQHRNMTESDCNSQPKKCSKTLKSILLNRNEKPVFSNSATLSEASQEVVSILNSGSSNELTHAEGRETSNVITDVDSIGVMKYAPKCSKKRKGENVGRNENNSTTKRSKGRRTVSKKSRAALSQTNQEILTNHAEGEIGDEEFAEGDEVIGSLLPLIKTKTKPKAKKKNFSGRVRGRAKRRGRLPSISSDEDIIEELSAAAQQPGSENNSNAQSENDMPKTEDDEDSDDGLVSFMGIIRNSDAVVPIIPDIKQEVDSDHVEDDTNTLTYSHSNDLETIESPTTQDQPGKSQYSSEPDNDGVGNIFAKFSKEMEEMNESQHLCEKSDVISATREPERISNRPNISNEIPDLPSSSKAMQDNGAIDDAAINSERDSGEPSDRKAKAAESQFYNCDSRTSRSTALNLDAISPNILTPPSSPTSDDNSKQARAHCSEPRTPLAQQGRNPVIDCPAHSTKETETAFLDRNKNDTVAERVTTICTVTGDTTENNQAKSEEVATDTANLIAAAAEMAGVPTSIPIESPKSTQPLVTSLLPIGARDAKDNSQTSLNRQISRPGITFCPITNTTMPAGKSCHGFLEICLYGFEDPNKFTYALRRIPYVRTTPYASVKQNMAEEVDGSELSSGACSTVTTYLRLRDVICLLKIDVGSLHSLITKCLVKLFRPSDYTKDLFATVYDPVGKLDPIIAKMTWRHASDNRVHEFLDHMIILDKFLHSILPRFYVETLNIRTSDVPNFVNVKIFKPIFEINEEVVKIFRKPYEYNSVLMKKDCSQQGTCANKRNFPDATPFNDRNRRSNVTKPEEIALSFQQRGRKGTTWDKSAAQNNLSSQHTPITVAPLSPQFLGNGQPNNRTFASLRFPAFADPRHFQSYQDIERRSLRNRGHHCDVGSGMVRTTAVGFNARLNETAYRADMIQHSKMGTMVSSESSEYMRKATSMLPLPAGLNLQNSISRFEMPLMPTGESHGQAVANNNNVSASSMAHVRFCSITHRGMDNSLPGNQQPLLRNQVVSKLCGTKNDPVIQRQNASESATQPESGSIRSGIDVLAEAAATVCATDGTEVTLEKETGRKTRSGHQTRRSPKVTKSSRSISARDDDTIQKPSKRKCQSGRTTRKSARGIKSK